MAVCYGVVIANALLGGQCLKAMYLVMEPNGEMKLFEFVILFGGLLLVLAQIPSFHSLRHINFFSLVLCLLYSALAAAASIIIGTPNLLLFNLEYKCIDCFNQVKMWINSPIFFKKCQEINQMDRRRIMQ